jgi:hypothetical protein
VRGVQGRGDHPRLPGSGLWLSVPLLGRGQGTGAGRRWRHPGRCAGAGALAGQTARVAGRLGAGPVGANHRPGALDSGGEGRAGDGPSHLDGGGAGVGAVAGCHRRGDGEATGRPRSDGSGGRRP